MLAKLSANCARTHENSCWRFKRYQWGSTLWRCVSAPTFWNVHTCERSKRRRFIYLHAAGSPDGLLWYVTLIHPREKLLIVPPAALITNRKYPGAGSMMQKVFEQIARRDSLNLMVSIAPKSDTWYQPQVQQTLSAEWYYLAPPGSTRQYWVHKLSYKGDGIPQMGIPHESMKPPLQMWD